jgi:hypothetical protein
MMNASSSNASFREASKPRLLDQVRDKCRLLHYSKRTERAYVDWIRRFILFHGKRHPREMGGGWVALFGTSPTGVPRCLPVLFRPSLAGESEGVCHGAKLDGLTT